MIPLTKPAHSQRVTLLLCGLAYLFGAVVNLRFGAYRPGMIWGDSGDGLFAIWVLRHGADWWRGLAPLADGRIFWPHNAFSFLWSELYLLPAPMYALLQKLTISSFAAGYSLGVLLSLAGFSACVFFVGQVLAALHEPEEPPPPCWVQPLVAYLAWFSISMLQVYKIQIVSSFWLLIMAGAMLAYRRTNRGVWMLVIWASLTAVFLSSSYFAAAGAVLFAAWAWVEWFRDPAGWWRHFLKLWPALLLGAGLMGAVVLLLARPGVQRYTPEYINSMALGWTDLVRPREDFTRAWMNRMNIGPSTAPVNIGAFLGWGWILTAVAWLFRARRDVWAALCRLVRSPLFLGIAVVLLLSQLKVREIRPVMAVLGFIAVGVALLAAGAQVGRSGRAVPRRYAIGLLAFFSVLLYGIALGPSIWYVREPFHPSVWAVLRITVPGVGAMRAVDRMAVVAQMFGWGLLLALLGRESVTAARPRARYWALALLLPAALQVIDQLPAHACATVQDERAVTPTHTERVFWETKTGVAVVLPAGPMYRNTTPMLYFQNFPGIVLINGYSGRSTDLMDGLIQAGRVLGEGSVKQVTLCEQAGAEWIVLRRPKIPAGRIEALRQSGRRLVFDDERFAVFEPLPRT